jgi:hypothetical protein
MAFTGGARDGGVYACICTAAGGALAFDARSSINPSNCLLRLASSVVSEACNPELEEDRLYGAALFTTG